MDDRVAREQAFHDARFGAEEARASDRFYSITESSRQSYVAKLVCVWFSGAWRTGDRNRYFTGRHPASANGR